MRALTIRQPWAQAVALGLKRIETRGRPLPPALLGQRIAIHAGLAATRKEREQFDFAVRDWGQGITFALAGFTDFEDLPLGAIVATARLVRCATAEILLRSELTPMERSWGDYGPGRWGWVLDDVLPLARPVPAKGALGFWEWREAA